MSEPQLREPDLPRSAKERPEALRTGWTTGACAAAAAKATAWALAGRGVPASVTIGLPEPAQGRERVELAVEAARVDDADPPTWAEAVVVKDAGDDPDVTHGAHLTVCLERRAEGPGAGEPGVVFAAGDGVGTVTKPGLGLAVGEPAINATPRAMIAAAVGEVVDVAATGWRCTISVPGGQAMAKKTTNRRLGIEGGISILGTTGVVRPFSTASWRASVEQQVDVLAAQGGHELALATGGRTEKAAMALLDHLPEAAFVEVGDFTGAALRRALAGGLATVRFVGMAGKLAKLAAGIMMTHWTKSKVDPRILACLTADAGGSSSLVEAVRDANSGRHAYELWADAELAGPAGARLCAAVADNLAHFAAAAAAEAGLPTEAAPSCHVALIDFDSLALVAASPNWADGAEPGPARVPSVPSRQGRQR